MRPDDPPLAGPLRAHARGTHSDEAGVELLIGHATFLRRGDFRRRFIDVDTHITDGTRLATVNWPEAISALDTGELCCSSGEERMLRVAASQADGLPVSLRDALTGIDERNIKLVTIAVLQASGQQPRHQTP